MSDETRWTTWDSRPVSPEPPHGATIVVYRRAGHDADAGYEFLLLHRAHNGPDYEGDWAWTPPSGARLPGEPLAACAARELREETGLPLTPRPTDLGTAQWAVYLVEVDTDTPITLDPEHDRFLWARLAEALQRCRPAVVADALHRAGRHLSPR